MCSSLLNYSFWCILWKVVLFFKLPLAVALPGGVMVGYAGLGILEQPGWVMGCAGLMPRAAGWGGISSVVLLPQPSLSWMQITSDPAVYHTARPVFTHILWCTNLAAFTWHVILLFSCLWTLLKRARVEYILLWAPVLAEEPWMYYTLYNYTGLSLCMIIPDYKLLEGRDVAGFHLFNPLPSVVADYCRASKI